MFELLFHQKLLKKNQKHPAHLAIGHLGEELAMEYLLKNQFQPVVRNYCTPIGISLAGRPITGEIDIIAYDQRSVPFVLAFIEVKTRSSREFAEPAAAVDGKKRQHIIKAARAYRRNLNLSGELFRYDVISIVLPPKASPIIELLMDYFTEVKTPYSKK